MDIYIEREKLSDGSYVFNVRVGHASPEAYPAISENDAKELAIKFQHAIHDHSTARVNITFRY